MQYISPDCWYISTKLKGITSQTPVFSNGHYVPTTGSGFQHCICCGGRCTRPHQTRHK